MDLESRLAELRSLATAIPAAHPIEGLELREAPKGSDSPGGVRFYAAVYDKLSLDLGGFREQIAPSTFDAAIAEDDIRALVNHDRNLVLGRSAPAKDVRTAEIESDERGLLVDIPELPNTTYARDLLESLDRGDVDQSSFGFRTVADEWDFEPEDGGSPIRTLTEARLFDVSIVTFPAYPDTIAEARSLALALAEIRVGKVLSAKSKSAIQAAADALTELLASVSEDDEENSAPAAEKADPARADTGAEDETRLQIARLRLREIEIAPVSTPTLR